MRVCSFDRLEFEENRTNEQTPNGQTILNAEGQNRTVDTRIFSPLLYQLSYLGKYDKNLVFFSPSICALTGIYRNRLRVKDTKNQTEFNIPASSCQLNISVSTTSASCRGKEMRADTGVCPYEKHLQKSKAKALLHAHDKRTMVFFEFP